MKKRTTKRTTKRTRTINNNFYCSQKFTWLTVDLERRSTYSCCMGTPSKIDLTWLKNNPGKIFNTPLLLQERQDMLDNIPVSSCEAACWKPEAKGLPSRRVLSGTNARTHTILESQPEKLNIILGSTCNLTCSYCDKQYSSSWLRDISNGTYLDTPKFTLTPLDRVMLKVSQKEHQQTDGFATVLNEVKTFTNVKNICITGGEPFLYNSFPELLNNLTGSEEIMFYTGLGVDHSRLKTQLSKINNHDNLTVVVSAENIDKFYEFNRYGNTYENFTKNLNLLIEQGFKIIFGVVLSNLTIHGLVDFVNAHGDSIDYTFCNDPTYLQINVLDSDTVDQLAKQISASDIAIKDEIIKALYVPNTRKQQENCATFLKEFARRRNLNLDIFPESMLQWLGIKENYVV